MPTLKEIQLFVAMFEGRSISLEEAEKIQKETKNRNKVLKTAFNLTDEEIQILCVHKDEVKELALALKRRLEDRVQENIRQIEQRTVNKMRDPRKVRQMRALLAPR